MNARQRMKMVKAIEALAHKYNCKSFAWEHDGKAKHEKIDIEFAKVSVMFNLTATGACQHWWGATENLNPMVFGTDTVNRFHHRKATVYRTIPYLLDNLEFLFKSIASGLAFTV